jgi:hypothetical protein
MFYHVRVDIDKNPFVLTRALTVTPRPATRLYVCCLVILLCGISSASAQAAELPIFDVHIHYSQDAWEAVPSETAVRRLRDAGIVRALVSSSSDDGTQKLYNADPELVVPALRPYRRRGEQQTWMHDETVVRYLEDRLARFRYAAIGELHISGEEANSPVMRQVVQLAREHNLIMHVHSDAKAIELLFSQDPKARILWAHAGFEDAAVVHNMMDTYANLWADLSFRQEIFQNDRFLAGWDDLLKTHSDRFMLGIDTYTPSRWLDIPEKLRWNRTLLASLSPDVAKRLAYQNADTVIGTNWQRNKLR